MAARTKAHPPAHRPSASDSEDDLATATAQASRKPSKAMPPKTATKRKAASKTTRPALKDRTNILSDHEDDSDETDMVKPKVKRAKTTGTAKSRAKKQTLGVIPETQPDPDQTDNIEVSVEMDEMDISPAPTPPPAQKFVQRERAPSAQAPSRSVALQPRASARSGPAQVFPVVRERSTSASGAERERRGADPEMRRRLNDLTTKHEDLSLKYQNLQELAKNGAESNFDKLKRAADQRSKDTNELVASLRKEIADLRKVKADHGESAALQKQVTSLTSANDKLTAANEKLAKDTATFKEKEQTAVQEAKTLDAKLAATRLQLSNSVQEGKVAASSRNTPANTSDAVRVLKMKETLYADLTNLIIRNVKITEDEDIYDCIQTGRNGTLHFHLSVLHDSIKTPGGKNEYDDYDYVYDPHLDEDRDRQLMAVLPDFLRESDIDFSRHDALKFFTKIFDSTTKKVVMEGDEEGGREREAEGED